MKNDVKVLDKLLNSPLIFRDYPFIKKIIVYEQRNKIEIVIVIREDETLTHNQKSNRYWEHADEVKNLIYSLAKMAGVTSRFDIYP